MRPSARSPQRTKLPSDSHAVSCAPPIRQFTRNVRPAVSECQLFDHRESGASRPDETAGSPLPKADSLTTPVGRPFCIRGAMSLDAGTRLGSFEIVERVGA